MANRLALETSPYLLQHAGNPVDWFPWGEEAIAKARSQDKPIFVSVGYSTCYWCHVMERESFADPAVAALLNRDFVSVKVDREERPDIDEVMMTACQAYTALSEGRSRGGWPLTVFLEPKTLRPFFAGTYFAPESSEERESFVELVESIAESWRNHRRGVEVQAERIFHAIATAVDGDALLDAEERSFALRGVTDAARPANGFGWARRTVPAAELVSVARQTASVILRHEDKAHGGFGDAPKFPHTSWLMLLEALSARFEGAGAALDRGLRAIVRGGIHDHLGGGFHRYAVDAGWQVPHFEKMLPDTALLVPLLAARRDPWLARAAVRGLEWMSREMLRDDGLFRAALDAEVDGRDGAFYLWRRTDLEAPIEGLSREDARWAAAVFGLDRTPSFHDPSHPTADSAHVLSLAEEPDGRADGWARLDRVSEAMRRARLARPAPRADDKAILAWNALAIRAFALGAPAMKDDGGRAWALEVAVRAFSVAWAEFVESHDERVIRVWRVLRRGLVPYAAQLEDVAALAWAATALAEATGEAWYDDRAWKLVEFATEIHRDEVGRWCERRGLDAWGLRGRSLQDGATPGGAGMIARVLATLARRGDGLMRARSLLGAGLAASASTVAAHPTDAALTLCAAYEAEGLLLPMGLAEIYVHHDEPNADGNPRAVELEVIFAWGFHVAVDPAHGREAALLIGGDIAAASLPEPNARVGDAPCYEGRVVIPVTLAAGAREVTLRCAPCDATRCLAPVTVRIPL
ncbi:MAG: DUF255 domain-containing protein [Phycisphaera sp.]|nr:DUF255 domain-containing protein [Phycisphaera sp.]